MRTGLIKHTFVLWVFSFVLMFMQVGQCGEIGVDAAMSSNYIFKGADGKSYLKVSLKGLEDKDAADTEKPKMNIAIVIDRSGSMQGDKIENAKQAAVIAINQLTKDDIISVIAYGSDVEVIVPATKATDRAQIIEKVMQITADGQTALYAGVAKGAAEVRKFLDKKNISRVVLLSDGQANVGPSSPAELGDFGASLAKEGMAVSTIGLGYGYNEDLMAELAKRSEGNFIFAETPQQLADIFDKGLGGARRVKCREARINITFPEYVSAVRTLGREANITPNAVSGVIREIYEGNEKFLLLELAINADKINDEAPVAKVKISYDSMKSGDTITFDKSVMIKISEDKSLVDKNLNVDVQESVATMIANERNMQILALRDAGKVKEANELNVVNDTYLKQQKELMPSSENVQAALDYNTLQKAEINKTEEEYQRGARKAMVQRQQQAEQQADELGGW